MDAYVVDLGAQNVIIVQFQPIKMRNSILNYAFMHERIRRPSFINSQLHCRYNQSPQKFGVLTPPLIVKGLLSLAINNSKFLRARYTKTKDPRAPPPLSKEEMDLLAAAAAAAAQATHWSRRRRGRSAPHHQQFSSILHRCKGTIRLVVDKK